MSYLDELNEPQREAVLQTEGPVMILAGAGSGKTRVLTYRIAHLIKKGVDPYNILSLTFTNKAAKEMRNRIEKVVGNEARNLWMGTFHSVFSRILRAECEKIGYPSNFTIYDTDDSKSLIKTILDELNLDDKIYKPSGVLSRISGAKNRLISVNEYVQDVFIKADDESSMRPLMGKIYSLYVQRCFKAGAMDFDDLLYNTHVLFKTHEDVLHKYQHRFKYVMVDEFQDTNISQYSITRKLAAVFENICVVGDDAQSIYGFRGADIQNILNFEKDYSDLKVFKLEQNYRSTQVIVNAANSVIAKNKAQLRKNVFTANEDGPLIELIKATSDSEEGRLVASSVFQEKMHGSLRNSDFCILYRTNSQSRSMEEALRRMNIPYRIYGGLSFYQRKEIKDLLSYLRFTINHNDEQALKRIINYPKRGIGDTTFAKIIVVANDQGASLWDVLSNFDKILPGRSAETVVSFATLIRSFEIMVQGKDAFEAATYIAKTSGILRELYDDKSIEGVARYENLQELLNAIKEFSVDPEREDKSLAAFIQEVALLTDADNDKDDNDKVSMMTIHQAKGLEYRNVYIVGMEEDLFPSQMSMETRADLEEERRLFYVAITRAEKKLTFSFATTRYRFGKLKPCEPSRFLDDVGKDFMSFDKKFSQAPRDITQNILVDRATPAHLLKVRTLQKTNSTNYVPNPNFQASDISLLQPGVKVEHQKFGIGTVIALDYGGSDKKAKINFATEGEKTLLLSFAKLMVVE
ncbi:MAG: UvrD-helicase domain-containing protein [Opitutaceae bacterium]|nr:UvrD-helicase domain-containing protein [Cytophagales bacterium]